MKSIYQMAIIVAVDIPAELYERDSAVLRPRDLASRYSRPANEVRRLVDAGILRPLAHGYYVVPPAGRVRDPRWRPAIEAVALALAVADYGSDRAALMGVSAARVLGGLPRAIGTAVVATPKQRPALQTPYGHIAFVRRDARSLDLQRSTTELASGYVTTVEQTILDLAERPEIGGLDPRQVTEAIQALAPRADWTALYELARDQGRKHAAYVRASWLAADSLQALPPAWPHRSAVPSLGLIGPPNPNIDQADQ